MTLFPVRWNRRTALARAILTPYFFPIAHQTISRLNHGTAFSIVDRYTWSSSLSLPAIASLDLEAHLFASVYRLHTKDMVC